MKLNAKLVTLFLFGTLSLTSLQAETTMCFKEDHKNFTTIEKVNLDGGLCNGSKTVQDMKKEGWSVDDIKISNSNYIYIFKKETTIDSVNMAELERKIIERLENKKKEDKKQAGIERRERMMVNGKAIYQNTCTRCHGEKAEKTPYNTARALINMNLSDFTLAIREYTLEKYDRGYAMIMRPYAITLNSQKIKEVYAYIQSIKAKKEETIK